jgi:MFS family permease
MGKPERAGSVWRDTVRLPWRHFHPMANEKMNTATSAHTSTKVFVGISSFQALAMFRRGLFYAYLSIYLRHYLGLSVTETTLFATLPMVMNIVFQAMVWGPYSDRTQLRRTLIIAGEILAGAGTVVVWYAHTLTASPTVAGYAIIFGLSVVEIFWSMSNVGWSALISDLYPESRRNAVQGRLASAGGLGRIAGVWIGGLLYDGLDGTLPGWGFSSGALFFVASGVMFLSVLPMAMVPEGGIAPADARSEASAATDAGDDIALFYWFLTAMVFINFGRNAVAIIVTQYLVLPAGFAVSSTNLAHIINIQSAAMIVTGMATGWFSRRLGDGATLLVSAAVALAALIIIAWTNHLSMIVVSSFLRGVTEVTIIAASYAVASVLIPPGRRARLFAAFNATFFLSWGLAGTFIAAPVADILMAMGRPETFAYRMSFVASAGVTLVGILILAWLYCGPMSRQSSRSVINGVGK